jgi:cyclic-di-GMP-binding protein
MSVQFERLSAGFTSVDNVQGQALPKETRSLKQWLDNLPRGNAKEMAHMLRNGLAQSIAVKMDGAIRFSLLEMLRPDVNDSVTWLERQFIGSPLPLTHDRLSNAKQTLELHILLADSYRLACYEICYPNGVIPMLRSGAVNGALARGIWHYQQALLMSWKLYQSSMPGVWKGLHRLYQFAIFFKLGLKDIEDPCLGRSVRIQDMYIETALMSLMNPYAFAQTEQDMLRQLAKSFSPRCTIERFNTSDNTAKIPIDADLPTDADLPDDEISYLVYSSFIAALELASQNVQGEQVLIELSKSQSIGLPVNVLKKTRRALGLSSARVFTRIYALYDIETVVALSGLHFYAAGQLDFESYIQKLSQMGTQGLNLTADWMADMQQPRTLRGKVLDHSFGGYRILWPADQALRVRVGEIVGLNANGADAEPTWMVGVIRWLRYEQDGSVIAGIKLLSRRCNAVALRINHAGRTGNLMRGLELIPLASDLPRRFLMSGRLESPLQNVEVMYSYEPNRLGPPRQVEVLNTQSKNVASNMDYSLLSVQST